MNVVITLAQLLAARTDGEEAAFAERIVGTAEELVAHSEKARTLEDAVNDPRQRRRIDAAAAVRTAADRTRGRQDGTVTVDAPDEQPVRATDRLIDAVAELATNALTHGADRVRLSVEDSGATTLIRVSDDGPGLDPAEARVLEQGNETPLKHGSGLGLFMIRWFVTGFGGSVSVDADDGTTVTIRLSGVDGDPGRRSADRRLPAAVSSE
jgi:signal transduction histidine kinase